MSVPVATDPRRALVDEAGKLYVLREELRSLRKQRDTVDAQIRRLELRVEAAKAAVESHLEKTASRRRGAHPDAASEQSPLTPGKLPHRVLAHMQREPTRIYTAGEIAETLGVADVQQIRTALARLVVKGLARRLGARGDFTL
jgi:Fic family protein